MDEMWFDKEAHYSHQPLSDAAATHRALPMVGRTARLPPLFNAVLVKFMLARDGSATTLREGLHAYSTISIPLCRRWLPLAIATIIRGAVAI